MTFFGAVHSKKVAPLRLHVPADLVVRALGPTAVTVSRERARPGGRTARADLCSSLGRGLPGGVDNCSLLGNGQSRDPRGEELRGHRRRVPLVLGLPTTISLEAAGPTGVRAPYRVTAMNVDGRRIEPNCVPPSGSLFPIGKTSVMCTAVNGAGHRARGHFMVIVRDDKAPKLSLPGDLGGASADKSLSLPSRRHRRRRRRRHRATHLRPGVGLTLPDRHDDRDLHGKGRPRKRGDRVLRRHRRQADGRQDGAEAAAACRHPPRGDLPEAPSSHSALPHATMSTAPSRRSASRRPEQPSRSDARPYAAPPTTRLRTWPGARSSSRSSTRRRRRLQSLPDVTVEANSPGGATVSFKSTATDRVDGVVTPRCEPTVGLDHRDRLDEGHLHGHGRTRKPREHQLRRHRRRHDAARAQAPRRPSPSR